MLAGMNRALAWSTCNRVRETPVSSSSSSESLSEGDCTVVPWTGMSFTNRAVECRVPDIAKRSYRVS
jgi:hypothetical protein